MDKNAILTFLIWYVCTCFNDETIECAKPRQYMRNGLLNHVRQEQHWRGMWFDWSNLEGRWRPKSQLWAPQNNTAGKAVGLRTVTVSMGCAYGVKLNWFLLLTLETIDECNRMDRNGYPNAGDCRAKLRASFGRYMFVVLKLVRTLEYIEFVSKGRLDANRFYQTLKPLEVCLSGHIPIVFSGIMPGGLVFNQLFNARAESLREFLLLTCRPNYRSFDITAIKGEYDSDNNFENYPNGIYALYVDRLDSYLEYVNGHLNKLGFFYDMITDDIIFNPGQSG